MFFVMLLMFISLTLLILTEIGKISWKKVYIKTSASLIFILIFWFSFIKYDGNQLFAMMVLLALICCITGDILLVFKKNDLNFLMGMMSFFCANIFFIIAFSISGDFNIISLLILVVLLLIAFAGIGIRRLELGKFRIPVYIYLLLMCVMITQSFSLNWSAVGKDGAVVASVGALLFGLSDLVLANNKFGMIKSSKLSAINLILYYIGISMIAASMAYL